MKDIGADYKQVNKAYKDAFQSKYAEGINSAVEEILTRYGIAEGSKLAHIVKNAMSKFLVALDSRADAYSDWYIENTEAFNKLGDKFGKPIHSNSALILAQDYDRAMLTASFSALMRIDMGRSQAYLNIVTLIERHLVDITDPKIKRKDDPSGALAGSIIRKTVDLYHQTNDNGLIASFSNAPRQTVTKLREKLGIK